MLSRTNDQEDLINYYDALRLADGSGYHYTKTNDGVTSPTGYCGRIRGCSECGDFGRPGCTRCEGNGYVDLGPEHYRLHAHETPEEARECFARYLLDGWREEQYGDWTGCVWVQRLGEPPCDRPTKKGLTTRPPLGHGYALCDRHRTFNHLADLAPLDAGQITASY